MGTTINKGLPYPGPSDQPNVPADIKNLAEAIDADTGVPVGTVISYAGIINEETPLPAGWLVCDGTAFSAATYPLLEKILGKASTPNLLDRFVKGVANRPDVAAGGSKKILEANMPSHKHDVSVSGGAHGHTGSTNSAGTHAHTAYYGAQYNSSIQLKGDANNAPWAKQNVAQATAGHEGGHGHGVTIDNWTGSHGHTMSEASKGSGADYEPKYYELIYLIKAVG